jgi:hypothetical protein
LGGFGVKGGYYLGTAPAKSVELARQQGRERGGAIGFLGRRRASGGHRLRGQGPPALARGDLNRSPGWGSWGRLAGGVIRGPA